MAQRRALEAFSFDQLCWEEGSRGRTFDNLSCECLSRVLRYVANQTAALQEKMHLPKREWRVEELELYNGTDPLQPILSLT